MSGFRVIRDWVLRFNGSGPNGPIDRKASGPAPKLDDAQRQALARVVENGPIPATRASAWSSTTPKHASWLNMVEIEIGVLRGQCLDRRIANRKRLVSEIAAWQHQRNYSGARIKWMFTID